MNVTQLEIEGCFLIKPDCYADERGFFLETFNLSDFEQATGIKPNFVQDNQSVSARNVIRGLHFQIDDFAQAKLVRVAKGKIFDVCVDLRPNSPTFGQYLGVYLDDVEHCQLYIPKGFAHGFLSMADQTIVNYKCDKYYNREYERGIIFNDKEINIEWPCELDSVIISAKDRSLPTFKQFRNGN